MAVDETFGVLNNRYSHLMVSVRGVTGAGGGGGGGGGGGAGDAGSGIFHVTGKVRCLVMCRHDFFTFK